MKPLPPVTPLIQKIDKLIQEAYETQKKAEEARRNLEQLSYPFRKEGEK